MTGARRVSSACSCSTSEVVLKRDAAIARAERAEAIAAAERRLRELHASFRRSSPLAERNLLAAEIDKTADKLRALGVEP